MARARKPVLPALRDVAALPPPPKGILELDRFTQANVESWNALSRDLDELNDVLQFGLEPVRRRRRPDLLGALAREMPVVIDIKNWVRIVSYKHSLTPLSSAGSLTYIGGRFNPGIDLEPNTIEPWPALYLAEDFETAFREKFQRRHAEVVDGLTPQELALNEGGSHSTVLLKGQLTHLFDLRGFSSLNGVARELAKIKMPGRASQLKRKLKIRERELTMARSGRQLFEMVVNQNWRVLPVQFGLPAPSQILAELICAAGFEGILYSSTKGLGVCVVIFPEQLKADSYVELLDSAPAGVKYSRLDSVTAANLSGWDEVGRGARRRHGV